VPRFRRAGPVRLSESERDDYVALPMSPQVSALFAPVETPAELRSVRDLRRPDRAELLAPVLLGPLLPGRATRADECRCELSTRVRRRGRRRRIVGRPAVRPSCQPRARDDRPARGDANGPRPTLAARVWRLAAHRLRRRLVAPNRDRRAEAAPAARRRRGAQRPDGPAHGVRARRAAQARPRVRDARRADDRARGRGRRANAPERRPLAAAARPPGERRAPTLWLVRLTVVLGIIGLAGIAATIVAAAT
jgi:hypothetical protein